MRIDQPRQHRLALQIDLPGLRTGQSAHLVVAAHGHDPIATNGDRLGEAEHGLDGDDLAVVQDEVRGRGSRGGRLSRGQNERNHQDGMHGGTFQPAPSAAASAAGIASGGERSFAASAVPGTIIGLGELLFEDRLQLGVVDCLGNDQPLRKASKAWRRPLRISPAWTWASARMCLISSSISRPSARCANGRRPGHSGQQ